MPPTLGADVTSARCCSQLMGLINGTLSLVNSTIVAHCEIKTVMRIEGRGITGSKHVHELRTWVYVRDSNQYEALQRNIPHYSDNI